MGYTHYWYKIPNIPQAKFTALIEDFKTISPHFEDLLDCNPIRKDELFFNGIGEDGHETFVFEKDVDMNGRFIQYEDDETKSRIFNFCKTAQKPYDIAVCCALIIAKKHLGDGIKVSSDGMIA